MMTFEEAVQEDVKRSLSDWAMYFYRIGYEDAESKIVYCKDCKYLPGTPRQYADDDVVETYLHCGYLGDDGHCSLGKRKEE